MSDSQWHLHAIIYQLHVKCFFDSTGDGIGDFRGLCEKLDYIESLGVTAIWLLPFFPSPLRDDGYDIADYTDVHPDYGSLADFKRFLREAHRRGLRVIIELVVNHTSDQHPWFQKACKAKPGSQARDFYVWSDTPEKYADARIIFCDFETSNWTWEPTAKSYYWHRFYRHQPDLNYACEQVQKEMLKVADFWLRLGVDGLRLDAVPYLCEREGTTCENLPESHVFLKRLRAHINERYRDRILLAEANQWPQDAAAYLAEDECHMAFHFPLMPRLYMGLRLEDRFPIVDILDQTPPIPPGSQWATFLRNHDELTLEMVTDEERDYMFRVFAKDPRAVINMGIRRRLAPLLENHRAQIELMNVLLFSLPGAPVLYYGDELGMGDNVHLGDRNGVRTPMQWNADRNAGFSKVNSQELYLPVNIDTQYHFEAVNVESQERNSSSLLWWTRRYIAMRRRYRALSEGSISFISLGNSRVLACIREWKEERILVVINLSRFSQSVELDLSAYVGTAPIELFSGQAFLPIRDCPYGITIGPYGHYWLSLSVAIAPVQPLSPLTTLPSLDAKVRWDEVLSNSLVRTLQENFLPQYLKNCKWFDHHHSIVQRVRIVERISIASAYLLILEVLFRSDEIAHYVVPVSFVPGGPLDQFAREYPQAVIARLNVAGKEGLLVDAVFDEAFRSALFVMIRRSRRSRGDSGELVPVRGTYSSAGISQELSSIVLGTSQSSTSVQYRDRYYLKLYRRIAFGVHPEVEFVKGLSDRSDCAFIPPFGGSIDWQSHHGESMTIALLEGYIPNEGTAWEFFGSAIRRYLEAVLASKEEFRAEAMGGALMPLAVPTVSAAIEELIGGMPIEAVKLIARHTADLHLASAEKIDLTDFVPEPFNPYYQQSLYQAVRSSLLRTMITLRKKIPMLKEPARARCEGFIASQTSLLNSLRKIVDMKIDAFRIRLHGNYDLKNLLYTGKDFVIVDFEGPVDKPLSVRRLKVSPLVDVVSMIGSFHYAVFDTLYHRVTARPEEMKRLEGAGDLWWAYMSAHFLQAYLKEMTAAKQHLLPKSEPQLAVLLNVLFLSKSIADVAYDADYRMDWLDISLRGLRGVISSSGGS